MRDTVTAMFQLSIWEDKAEAFLKMASSFSLGHLMTEQPNPLTEGLSELAQTDRISEAISVLKSADHKALDDCFDFSTESGKHALVQIECLAEELNKCRVSGGRVFLCGCGSTGRLSLTLERIWRRLRQDRADVGVITSFMAGGDLAMIHSLEGFEDLPEYGARQLQELGFKEGDILVSITEGGETPWVIGACNESWKISSLPQYFLYCNPDHLLMSVQRSKEVIENDRVVKIPLSCGPQGIAGSTRMQASTVLMAAVGACLVHLHDPAVTVREILTQLRLDYKAVDISFIESFIHAESDCYLRGERIFYQSQDDLAMAILTDTTERAPTFSLHAFDNRLDQSTHPSLSYLFCPQNADSKEAWNDLFRRTPRTLEWEELKGKACYARLLGFDFSKSLPEYRASKFPAKTNIFHIQELPDGKILFELESSKFVWECDHLPILLKHLMLKMILNTHSTIIMGKLGRYQSNIMTWVRPSNKKLIDRSVRNIKYLLAERKIEKSQEELMKRCFKEMETLAEDEPLVLKVFESILKEQS